MNTTTLFNTPVFWITLFEVVLFTTLSVLIIKFPRKEAVPKKGINPVLLGMLIILLGFFAVWLSRGESILWAFQSHDNLLTTPGKIISSSVDWRGSPVRNTNGLHFEIWYEYEVNETLYKSDRVNYGPTGSSDAFFAAEYVEKYPTGKSVIVYYDPGDPAKAVLEPEVINYDGALILVMIAALGLFFISTGLAPKRPQ